jgi:hypothetical protein
MFKIQNKRIQGFSLFLAWPLFIFSDNFFLPGPFLFFPGEPFPVKDLSFSRQGRPFFRQGLPFLKQDTTFSGRRKKRDRQEKIILQGGEKRGTDKKK